MPPCSPTPPTASAGDQRGLCLCAQGLLYPAGKDRGEICAGQHQHLLRPYLGLVARAASFTEDTDLPLTLGNFLDYYHLDPRAIYSKKVKDKPLCFSRLQFLAGISSDFAEPLEETLTKAFARLCGCGFPPLDSFSAGPSAKLDNTDFADLPPVEQRMLQMFYVTVWGKAAEDWNSEEVLDNLYALRTARSCWANCRPFCNNQYEPH